MGHEIAEGGVCLVDELELVVITTSEEPAGLTHMVGCGTWPASLSC